MSQNKNAFPIPAIQKPLILFGFTIVQLLLKDAENPFSQGVLKCMNKERGFTGIYDLIRKCEADKVEDNWTLELEDMLLFYMLNDLIVRIFRSDYYLNMIKKAATYFL